TCGLLGLLATGLIVNCGTDAPPQEVVRTPSIFNGEVQLELTAKWLSNESEVLLEPASAIDVAGRHWFAGLEYVDSKSGPRVSLVAGVRQPDGKVDFGFRTETDTVALANPSLCAFEDGVYLIYEAGRDGERGIFGRNLSHGSNGLQTGEKEQIGAGHTLFPTVVETSEGALDCVFQVLVGNRYEIHSSRRDESGSWSQPIHQFTASGDSWKPRAASRGDGILHVVYDTFDEDRFVVEYATLKNSKQLSQLRVADSRGYQGMPSIALDDFGRTWIAWEQAGQFGEIGGLRTNRELRVAAIENGEIFDVPGELLQGSNGNSLRADFPRIACGPDGLLITSRTPGGTWVPAFAKEYAEFYTSWFTRVMTFGADGRATSGLLRGTDGDGEATEVLLPSSDRTQVECVFVADLRTRRRPKPGAFEAAVESNWRLGVISLPAPAGFPETVRRNANSEQRSPKSAYIPSSPKLEVDQKRVLFGDLHRHTQLSRCQGTLDGTSLDAYRYARGPGHLDFISITDHYQHLVPWSLWRSFRDVDRFNAPGSLVTFAGMERALRERAHINEVFLSTEEAPREVGAYHRDVAATSSVAADRSLAIPHMMGTATAPFPWEYFRADQHRVLEVYQGLRGSYEGAGLPFEAMNREIDSSSIAEGQRRGNHFGLIAASDHRASSSAFAGVWATDITRESIFTALRSRDVFGSSNLVAVTAKLGSLVMGSEGTCAPTDELVVTALGTAPIATIEIIKNGELFARRAGEGETELIAISCRRYQELGIDPPDALEVGLDGGTIVACSERMQGRTGGQLTLVDNRVSLTKRIPWIDFVLEIKRDANLTGSPILKMKLGELNDDVRIDDIEPGRSIKHPKNLVRESIWRIGQPVQSPDASIKPSSFRFQDPARVPGDSYYARIVFRDGNLAWTSPIRVNGLTK
ncbi:MAG: hypothetical protein ACI87A_003009, partial [Planctomycetota bacterium]